MRLVLDTNVLANAFGTRGLCLDHLCLVLDEHELLVSVPLLDELKRVLDEKFGVPIVSPREMYERSIKRV